MTSALISSDKKVMFPTFPVVKNEVIIFEKSLKSDSYSLKTQKAIIFDLTHFMLWYLTETKSETISLTSLTKEDIENYQSHCKNILGHAPSTIRRKLLHLRQLFQVGVELKKLKISPL